VLPILSGCNFNAPKGYTEIQNGIYYKLVVAGDASKNLKPGDFVRLDIKGDTLPEKWTGFEDEEGLDTFTMGVHPELSIIEMMIKPLQEGDSAVYVCQSQSNTSGIFKKESRFQIRILQHKTAKQVKEEILSHDLWMKERANDENKLLHNFLEQNYPGLNPDLSGIVFIDLVPGQGELPQSGDDVFVEYTASFLSGKEFYSTGHSEPFEFSLGEQGQVLKGMEIGVRRMREGGKARFIVPSSLAFGEKGSSGGVVPPFKTLIFDVELVKIIHKPNS
jgi:FKBP-type peptidyl-prolyl cis-trans isomerase